MNKMQAPGTIPGLRSYSLPQLSPLYGEPPFVYQDSQQMLILFQTTEAFLASHVPAPLRPTPDATMFCAVSHFFCTGMGSYNEVIVGALALHEDRPVNFPLYLLLDNDVAICGGREIWGFPKKLGRVSLEGRDDVMHGVVERGGIQLVEAAVHLAEPADPTELAGSLEYCQLKLVPSVVKDAPPEVMQLTSTTLEDVSMRKVVKGPATLTFGTSPADRLGAIPVEEVLGGYFYTLDMTLGYGRIIHDYLAETRT